MKIIFLDFDGCLLTLRTMLANAPLSGWSRAQPDDVLCRLLRAVCNTGVKIVVSSAWRDNEFGCRSKLREGHLEQFLHPDWRTGDTGNRSDEIQAWLTDHSDVEDYLIIDDEAWPWTQHQAARWVICDGSEGINSDGLRMIRDWVFPR